MVHSVFSFYWLFIISIQYYIFTFFFHLAIYRNIQSDFFQIFVDMVEDTKNETKTPLLSANLSYPTRPYVAQMPALMRIIGHYTDAGRPMPKPGSPEAEAAVGSQLEDEQEQRLVYNQDTQPVEVINPFVRWHRRWYRSKGVEPSPTEGIYYTPFNMALEPWAMGLGDMGCAKIFKQYRMCTHMV
jgi:hypothetical protein